MKRASTFSAVVVATLAIGTAGPARAQSGTATAGQAGSSGAGSGQSNPAGSIGAESTSSIPGGGQSGSDASPRAPKVDERQQFIDKAAVANMAEIQLGQLAASNAQDPQVKQFARMMVDEHTKALDELRTAAGSATLPSSLDKKHQKVHDKLARLQGASFDRAYMDAMVDAHKDAEKLLSKRVGHGRSADAPHGTSAMAGAAGASGSGNAAGATGTSGTGTPSQPGDATGTSSGATTTAGATGTSGSAAGGVDEWAASTLPRVQSHLAQARTIEAQVKQEQRPPVATPDTTMPPRTPDTATPTQPGPPTPPQR